MTERLTIVDDMTIYHAATQKQQLIDALRAADELDLDLSLVAEIDTAGFQLLLLAKREARRLDKALNIVAHSPAVREVVDFFNVAADFGDPILIHVREADSGTGKAHG
ncbi:STAS domain-containing protein [Crenobacter sp. SG2305]|uniref:STAS domain-containing protein n=1 Tax=Crenobacter oryzisoli TaxID=3056844 RepID=UPI0025AACB67|nr:STAS domain-containing protein [Crenobacter sp. SG2305]MDN0085160.1 STAS domain-containing protein [Crenobacter sp. SG2305]